jgi:hypothetical protein
MVGTTRLRVLNSLPRRHQDYFFGVVRKLCSKHIAYASRDIPTNDRDSEASELFSEVMAKLLGVAGISSEHTSGHDGTAEVWQSYAHDEDPKRDERVAWLIEEVGGQKALAHRYEDVRRRRHGGKWRGDGYRQVQLEPEHVENIGVDPDDPHHDKDIRRVWRGLIVMAKHDFRPDEDASILLNLMARDSDIQAGFGAEWPIRQIVNRLNKLHLGSNWTDDRVDNAKKRLTNWIARLKRVHGLDPNDLMDLFARYGRSQEEESQSFAVARSATKTKKTAAREAEP